jgi:hypothetical protein
VCSCVCAVDGIGPRWATPFTGFRLPFEPSSYVPAGLESGVDVDVRRARVFDGASFVGACLLLLDIVAVAELMYVEVLSDDASDLPSLFIRLVLADRGRLLFFDDIWAGLLLKPPFGVLAEPVACTSLLP